MTTTELIVAAHRSHRSSRVSRCIQLSTLAFSLCVVATVGSLALPVAEAHADSSVWAITPSPNQGTDDSFLYAVSCVSLTSCMAVGDVYQDSEANGEDTLIETWNGTTWSIIPSPNPGSYNVLNGVSCTSTSNCVAVGYYEGAMVERTLVESWNGSAWSVVTSPNQAQGNIFEGVSCVSLNYCTAVGSYLNGSGADQTLIESWNGTAWSIAPSPNEGAAADSNGLYGVSCTSSSSCQAVGVYQADTLVESWNGSAWSIVPSPNQGSEGSDLLGVSCSSSTSCMAVGGYYPGSTGMHTMAESWNGSTWSITPSPNPGTYGAWPPFMFVGVSCASSSSCVMVSYYNASPQTEIETWNGSTWALVSSPNQSSDVNHLYGVSCTSSAACEAVGYYEDGTVYQTLIENETAVVTPTQVSTSLSGDSQSGSTISVPVGTSVADSATLSGANTPTAGGTVTYNVYSDNTCTTSVASADTMTVTDGVVPDSSPVTISAPGTYYWQASYSGDTYDGPSSSTCGSEIETVFAAPVAQPLTYGTAENTALVEASGSLQSGVSDSNPTATSWTAAEASPPGNGAVTVNADGSFTYTPTTGFTGADSFTYTLIDNLGFTSAPATVTITVSSSCDVAAWPAAISGVVKPKIGSRPYYYVGEVGGRFTVWVAHKGAKEVTETGTVIIGPDATGVGISNFSDLRDELVGANSDSVDVINATTIQFTLHTFGGVDGFNFTASCGSSVTFSLSVKGRTTKAKQIHLGDPTSKAHSNPFSENR